MINKKFIINFTQLLKHGSDGSYQPFLFRATLEDKDENVFVFDGFKILSLNERFIFTKIFVQQFTKDGKDLGFYSFDYKFSVSATVKILNNKLTAKNHIELAFADLFLKLYDKKIMARNFNRNNFVVNEKIDELATIITKNDEENDIKGEKNDTL